VNHYCKQQGVAAVELAILVIPLLLLAFGITEFGRALYQYNALTKATRDATRFLSEQGAGDAGDVLTAQCMTVYGNKTCTGNPLVPNLTAAMVSVCDMVSCPDTHLSQATGSGVINLVTVTISGYPFTSLVPGFVPSFGFGPISTTMRQ
jgi:Flp pilus assembly protein TadG